MGTAKAYLGGRGDPGELPLEVRDSGPDPRCRGLSQGRGVADFLCPHPGPIEEGSSAGEWPAGTDRRRGLQSQTAGLAAPGGGPRRAGAAPGSARPPIGRRGATPLYRETRLAARGGPCPRAGFVRRAARRSFNNGRRERPGAGPELRRGLGGPTVRGMSAAGAPRTAAGLGL